MMILAVALLTTMSALVKVIDTSYHPAQITFMRSIIAMAFILPFVIRAGGISVLKTKRPGLHLMRSLAGTLGTFFSFIPSNK